MKLTEAQKDFSEQLTENLLRQVAKSYKKTFKVTYYADSKFWVLCNIGERVKEWNPTPSNPYLYFVLWKNRDPMAVEVILENGKIRGDERLGHWEIKNLKDLGFVEVIANMFYKEKWSHKLCETIRDVLSKPNKL